jgi:hypothetical protein
MRAKESGMDAWQKEPEPVEPPPATKASAEVEKTPEEVVEITIRGN